MTPATLTLVVLGISTVSLLTISVLAARALRRREQQLAALVKTRSEDRSNLARFHSDLSTSPGMRLIWKSPESALAQENSHTLELTGTVEVETIDHDGRTQNCYSVTRGHAVVPVTSGLHTAVSLDDVDRLDVYIIEGHVNSVNVTLRSGLTLGTANLSS